jgi:uncharacterized membrane protein YhaH (DUF805 family)
MLQLFFNANGSLEREPFLLGWLFWVAVEGALLSGLLAAGGAGGEHSAWFAGAMLASGVSTVSLVVLAMKRLRHVGIMPWAAASVLVPVVSLLVLVGLSMRLTEDERNERRP